MSRDVRKALEHLSVAAEKGFPPAQVTRRTRTRTCTHTRTHISFTQHPSASDLAPITVCPTHTRTGTLIR